MKGNIWMYIAILFAVIVGALATLLYVKSDNHQPPTTNTPLAAVSAEPPKKVLYTENDVQQKLKYERDRNSLKRDWKGLITVSSDYGENTGIGGGFRNVRMVISNGTDYLIDEVTVLVTVKNGIWVKRPCHTEVLTFDNLEALSESVQMYSHTECGLELHVTVIGVKCTALNLKLKE